MNCRFCGELLKWNYVFYEGFYEGTDGRNHFTDAGLCLKRFGRKNVVTIPEDAPQPIRRRKFREESNA